MKEITEILNGYFLPLVICILITGCGSSINAYKKENAGVKRTDKLLVLPFLDSRTFTDKTKANTIDNIKDITRNIFVDELRKNKKFARTIVIMPKLSPSNYDYSLAKVLRLAKKYDCNIVFCGQIFSFVKTRAASIPPRAGLFIRIYDVRKKAEIFVGESYSAAGAPGARGGREYQCKLASKNILNNFLKGNSATTVTIPNPSKGSPKVLILPYYEKDNPINLIDKTGGGPVVSSIFGMELAKRGKIDVRLGTSLGNVSYGNLIKTAEAIKIGKKEGADYVVRGQVTEFRRAQSVPSLWSAAISLSILAAQVMFAETSGVDIATEVYRVKDGKCIFAKRDISHQKYVVSAEKTVREIAQITIPALSKSILSKKSQTSVTPIINSITVPKTEKEIKEAAEKIAKKQTQTGKIKTAKKDTNKTLPLMNRR